MKIGYDNKKYSEIDYAKDLSDKIGVKNISKKISKNEYFDNQTRKANILWCLGK